MTLTLFTIMKSFGISRQVAELQWQSLQAWSQMEPTPEIIVFGDAPGVRGTCKRLGLRQVADLQTDGEGLEFVSDAFARVSAYTDSEYLTYLNADIILPIEFPAVVERVGSRYPKFMMTGRRWNMTTAIRDIRPTEDWWDRVYAKAMRNGKNGGVYGMDYFAFRRDTQPVLPPLLVGRWYWDTALIGICKRESIPVVDASAQVLAVHQNHDYSHYPGGIGALSTGLQSQANQVHVPEGRLWNVSDADVVLKPEL